MAQDLNKIFLSGNLTKDPEIVDVGNSKKAKITLASTRSFKTKAGEPKEDTVFVPCEVWDSGADVMEKWLQKGDKIFIEGQWKTDEWDDKEGNGRRRMDKVRCLHFEILKCKKFNEPRPENSETEPVTAGAATNDGDDIPF